MSKDSPILTLSVVAKLLKTHPRTLMLYEKSNLISPHRTNTKRRLFSINNVNDLQFIKHLTQKEGMGLKGIKLLLEAVDIGNKNGINLKKRLFPNYKQKRLL